MENKNNIQRRKKKISIVVSILKSHFMKKNGKLNNAGLVKSDTEKG